MRQDKILFLSLIAAPEGIHKICAAFPQVKVITSEIDEAIDESFQVIPGVGEWGGEVLLGENRKFQGVMS